MLTDAAIARCLAAQDLILTITTGGAGKTSSSHDYPVRGRGGLGVNAMNLTDKRDARPEPWWPISRSS